MKLSDIKKILTREKILLTKSLGQNFLHDQNQLNRIVQAAELHMGEPVLEIGPGLGPLTAVILETGATVLAIEKDRRLGRILQKQFEKNPRLTLLQTDALEYLQTHPRDWSQWKVVSNLPYSVASPILVELAESENPPDRVVVTLQLEVAQRIMSTPGEKDYGLLTLLLQKSFEPKEWFKIPAGCFFPPPDVDSACVVLERRTEPLMAPEERPVFKKIVKRAFSQRRKMMFKLLKGDWPAAHLESAFSSAGLPLEIRAEKVSLEQFAALTRQLCQNQ